ncbi:MAG: hypothetical protein P1V21_22690 [Rhizobiaceae bacterium]|nr:hypothetical protein [Rhizobiaceae bacterium]
MECHAVSIGARRFRQILSNGANQPGDGPEIIKDAYDAVQLEPAMVA